MTNPVDQAHKLLCRASGPLAMMLVMKSSKDEASRGRNRALMEQALESAEKAAALLRSTLGVGDERICGACGHDRMEDVRVLRAEDSASADQDIPRDAQAGDPRSASGVLPTRRRSGARGPAEGEPGGKGPRVRVGRKAK